MIYELYFLCAFAFVAGIISGLFCAVLLLVGGANELP